MRNASRVCISSGYNVRRASGLRMMCLCRIFTPRFAVFGTRSKQPRKPGGVKKSISSHRFFSLFGDVYNAHSECNVHVACDASGITDVAACLPVLSVMAWVLERKPFSRYCPIELATLENTLFAWPPISRSVPTTITKMTASITAYSAISCPSSCDQSLRRKSVMSAPRTTSILYLSVPFSLWKKDV